MKQTVSFTTPKYSLGVCRTHLFSIGCRFGKMTLSSIIEFRKLINLTPLQRFSAFFTTLFLHKSKPLLLLKYSQCKPSIAHYFFGYGLFEVCVCDSLEFDFLFRHEKLMSVTCERLNNRIGFFFLFFIISCI